MMKLNAQIQLLTPATVVARLRLSFPPLVNRLYAHRAMQVRGKWTAVLYKTEEHAAYFGAVGNAVRVAKLRDRSLDVLPFRGPVVLTVRLYRARKAGDWDGPLKTLCDALNGIAWVDDSQVCEGHVYRLDDKADPRVELEIEGVP